jgi:hypothetical protein
MKLAKRFLVMQPVLNPVLTILEASTVLRTHTQAILIAALMHPWSHRYGTRTPLSLGQNPYFLV